jgi:hypothetical protein
MNGWSLTWKCSVCLWSTDLLVDDEDKPERYLPLMKQHCHWMCWSEGSKCEHKFSVVNKVRAHVDTQCQEARMPVNNFNQIETDEYRISPTKMVVRKDVIANGKSGADIFRENNIEGQIVETLPPEDVSLDGKKPKACFVYKIKASQLTNEEVAKLEAEEKKKAEEQAKIDSEAAKAAANSAPPPPPTSPPPPLKSEEKDPGPPPNRLPGQLPKA